MEEFLAIAFKAHPYGEPTIGHMSDVETMTRSEARAFFQKYYVPSNFTLAIVGDVHLEEIQSLAKTYFGRLPAAPTPDPVETVEPPQTGQRRVVVEDPSQPWVVMGYHTPDINHADNAVLEAMSDILGTGRTSRLYKSLVKEKKIAVNASAFQGFQGANTRDFLCSLRHRLEVTPPRSVRKRFPQRLNGSRRNGCLLRTWRSSKRGAGPLWFVHWPPIADWLDS